MPKKKMSWRSAMSLKQFHGLPVLSDLPLPSTTEMTVDHSIFDRQASSTSMRKFEVIIALPPPSSGLLSPKEFLPQPRLASYQQEFVIEAGPLLSSAPSFRLQAESSTQGFCSHPPEVPEGGCPLESWIAETLKETGAMHRGRVGSWNCGGVLVQINSLQGFLPNLHIDCTRIPKDGSKTISEIANELVGRYVSVKVIECLEAKKKLIVSEKPAVLVDIIQQIQEGTIYVGKVNCVTSSGAFVDLQFPDGSYNTTKELKEAGVDDIKIGALKAIVTLGTTRLRKEPPLFSPRENGLSL